MDDDLEVDVGGIPLPSWLATLPDQVTTVTLADEIGNEFPFTFEAFIMVSGTFRVHCTYPRRASHITVPDPDNECHWSYPTWDEAEMINHARMHCEGIAAPQEC